MKRKRTGPFSAVGLAAVVSLVSAGPPRFLLVGSARAAESPAAAAAHTSTASERQARGEAAARAFMLGRYEEALATYLDLYIQSDGRAEYLRNIGRCQQKLKQYPRAIESFKDYLRRAKRLGADERKEVEGFISEMETAQAQEAAGAGAGAGARASNNTRANPSAHNVMAPVSPPAAPTPMPRAPASAPAPAPAPPPAAPVASPAFGTGPPPRP